jgi:hypothetical protein
MRRDDLPQVFFHRLDVALHHTIQLGVQERCARFDHSETL